MLKDKCKVLLAFLLKHSKIAFPLIICMAVALTVAAALRAGNSDKIDEVEESTPTEVSTSGLPEEEIQDIPLVENEDDDISSLLLTYYNAMANGDIETITSLCDVVSEKDAYHYEEYADYIDYYPEIEIYTKPGPEAGSTIAYVYYKVVFINHEEEFPGYQAYYVCTGEDGKLYLKRGENTDEVNEYIREVSSQDNVVEFNNRINVEYNDLLLEKPELFEYLTELDAQVNTAVGERLAKANEEENTGDATEGAEATEGENGENADNPEGEVAENAEPVVMYAIATTTVNVRSSDSENADRLGKVAGGDRIKVLEQRVNGWTKVEYEGKEGYIKSEFLEMAENAANAEVVGTVTAKTNVNVRAAASQNAERLGGIVAGDELELLGKEGDWCKVKYNGQIGYIKSEFVE
ncbi:MAG: SH3 domain-containing protein [Lachnospiraceae bacterium]|nr:SH3 domain-containing protein [Lachnospiraceae bacterium]